MSLDELFMPPLTPTNARRVIRMDPLPPPSQPLTPAQIEQRRRARAAQIGLAKAANRIKR